MKKNIQTAIESFIIITCFASFRSNEYYIKGTSLTKAEPSWWYVTNQSTNAILRKVIINDPPCSYRQGSA
jgi:hypothetical protein